MAVEKSSYLIGSAIAVALLMVANSALASPINYGDALTKSILFFEGQRSGKLPHNQRMKWRRDSGLRDGFAQNVDLVGGYYDAGDNIKFHFPMAFTTTILAWSVLEYGNLMGPADLKKALQAIKWGTDYLLKATNTKGVVYAQVGDPYADHKCWERPEDMDTPRTAYAVTASNPGSEVSAEIAAALAASSIVFKKLNPSYSTTLLGRAVEVFDFADKYQGSYANSLGAYVCPFYCDYNGYQDELIWGAAWLYAATRDGRYWGYVNKNIGVLEEIAARDMDGSRTLYDRGNTDFGWDAKQSGISVLMSKFTLRQRNYTSNFFVQNAGDLICKILPESPTKNVVYSRGGLFFRPQGSNLQYTTAVSFLLLTHARYLKEANKEVHCGNVVASPSRIVQVVKSQVDYILGKNPANYSYMVGYGDRFPQKIHHRGSSLPSIVVHPQKIDCDGGNAYAQSPNPNPNLLVGAVVGGPSMDDSYVDSRQLYDHAEPMTYLNAPLVGILAYFKAFPTYYY